jgi:hypothetical protein
VSLVPIVIGVLLGLGVGIMSTGVGLARDRALYPAAMIVIAAYYVLFAVMGGSTQALVAELLVGMIFVAAALWGFRSSLWIVAAAIAGHGVFDVFHGAVITNPGMPTWWPAFCSSIDVTLGVYLAWLLRSGRVRTTP